MDLTNVRNVGRHLIVPVPIEYMKDLTLERNPTNVNSVVEPSVVPVPFEHMKELTLERSPTNVRSVGKLSIGSPLSKSM